MDKEQAKRKIKDTFEAPFNEKKFIYFIMNLLNLRQNDIENTSFGIRRGYNIPEMFRPYISRFKRVAKYLKDNNRIDILIVYLKKGSSIEHARSRQRNFIAGYLKGNYGSDKIKDAALVAFVSPNKADWRFSLVKMDYRFKEGKVKEGFTPAKRWSFLVGKNESSHTAQSRLVRILADDQHNPTLTQLEEAFNIEKVTKEFFIKYRNLFLRIKGELDKVVEDDPKVKKDFEEKGVDTVNFAKKFLGQIVFLYFLQKKGWFGVERDGEWGTGPKDFLRQLFNKKYGNYKNFFNDILEPLFYEALARERDDNFYSRFNCKIPFLNGGLFEPIGGYDWVHTDINLSTEIFSNRNDDYEGNGVLDIFDLFNFTVKEDEPLEKEVAIDPELLGKTYEKFNAIRPDNYEEYKKALKSGKKGEENKFNKKFGVYYTPREIVHYMCQESLINYLHTVINQELMKQPAREPRQIKLIGPENPEQLRFHTDKEIVDEKAIEELIKYGEQFTENEAIALIKEQNIEEGKQKSSKTKPQLSESIRKNAKLIDDKLTDIRVCDPAVGSGAFPVGMMAEIVKTRNVLTAYIKEQNRTPYNFKRECIEKSLYGVDIDPGAVEIAKLRLWLSLIVDEEDITKIRPLPNLDYKIVCGNSLLGFPETWGSSPIEKEIEALMDEYFSITNPEKKRELKTKIDEKIKSRYATSEKIFGYKIDFDFKTVFSKVFREKSGFDVAIANPPYVRQEKIKDQKQALEKQRYEVYNSTSDLYTYFYERSHHILKPNGFSCFISSNKWMRAKYGEKLRRFFKGKTTLKQIIDFNGYQVFDATVDTNILLFQNIKSSENTVNILNIQPDFTPSTDITNYFNSHKLEMKQSDFDINCFTFGEEIILNLKKKIEEKGIPLGDWDIKIYRGVTTGFNKAFIVDTETKEQLCAEDAKSAEIIKPILRGRDISRYYYDWKGLWIIFTKRGMDIEKYPAIKNYLLQYKEMLEPKKKRGPGAGRKPGPYKWYEIQDNTAYYPEFEKDKIVWREIVDHSKFTWDNKAYFALAKVFTMTGKENNKYLLAILNSTLGDFAIKKYYSPFLGEKINEFKKEWVQKLPIPKISESDQKLFIELVDKILSITKDADYLENPAKQSKVREYERQIDQMVYKLYGLTEEEIKIVEKDK
jgi:hypothetical protein